LFVVIGVYWQDSWDHRLRY